MESCAEAATQDGGATSRATRRCHLAREANSKEQKMTRQGLNPLPHHDESSALVSAAPERVFAFIDDHERLLSHMSQSSWRIGGGRMHTTFDDGRGQRVGSRIRVSGRILGLELSLDEVVIEREPPSRKVWETVGSPRLLVIGPYRMGFDVTPRGSSSWLRVFIDYAMPSSWPDRWLGGVFGGYYAHWCTQRMVNDAVRQFASSAKPIPAGVA